MDDGPRTIEARVAALERGMRGLEAHLAAIEQPPLSSVNAQRSDVSVERSELSLATQPGVFDPVALLTLVGRTFVVLGGAYLLRALTESGTLPVTVGVTLGFAYAAIWLVAADRTASAER